MAEGNSLLDALAHPTVFNPLAAYQGAAQTANSIWQTRDWQAKQAAGAAQQGAIDPATGEYSPEKMRQGLAAAGPTGALAAQSSLAANQALSSDQLNQARDKLGWVAKASGAALTAGDYSDAAMMRVMMQGSADRMMTMPEIVRQLQSMPTDPAGRKAWLEQHQNQAMSTAQQLELRYGAPITVDDGQVVRGGTRSLQTGAITVPPGQGVQKQTGPETNAELVELSDPDGRKYKIPRSSLPGSGGQAPGGVGTGRPPPALRNPNAQSAPDAATPPAPGAVPAGATLTEIAPDKRAALTGRGTAAAAAFNDITDQGKQAVGQNAILGNMLGDTTLFTPGAGAEGIARIRNIAERLGVSVNTEGLTAFQSFQKLAAQLNAGQGSDARLAISEASNPHADLSPGALDLMLRQLQGNGDYNVARSKLAAAYPDKTDREGFETSIGLKLDPRAFQYARMTDPQKVTYIGSLSKDDQKTVAAAYNYAHKSGLLSN